MLVEQVHARVKEMLLDAPVDLLRMLGAQMAYGAVDELEVGADGTTTNLGHRLGILDALDVRVRAKVQIDLIATLDGRRCERHPDEVRQIAAHVGRERELAVRESASTRETRGNAAGLAANAVTDLLLGAEAALNGQSALYDGDLPLVALPEKAERAEDARRSRADDEHVGVASHVTPPHPSASACRAAERG